MTHCDDDLWEDDFPDFSRIGEASVDEDRPTPRVYQLRSVSQAFADAMAKKPKASREVGFVPRMPRARSS